MPAHKGEVTCLTYCKSSHRLVSAGNDNAIRVWNLLVSFPHGTPELFPLQTTSSSISLPVESLPTFVASVISSDGSLVCLSRHLSHLHLQVVKKNETFAESLIELDLSVMELDLGLPRSTDVSPLDDGVLVVGTNDNAVFVLSFSVRHWPPRPWLWSRCVLT